MSDALQMLTNTQTIVRNNLEGLLQAKNVVEGGFTAILDMLIERLPSVDLTQNLQCMSKEMQDEGLILDAGVSSSKLTLKEQTSQGSGIEMLSMLLGNETISAKKDSNENLKNDQEYFKELSQEIAFFAVQNPPIQIQQIDKPIEANLDCNKEQAEPNQEVIAQMPKMLEMNNISGTISEKSSNNKDLKKRINENIEGIVENDDVITQKDTSNLADDKAAEKFVLTQDKLTILFAKQKDGIKDQQSPISAKNKVHSLPLDMMTSQKSEDKQKVIAQADNQNLVFEQINNQTDTGRPLVSEKSIEIQANRLSQDLPEIIKVELEQSVGKEGSKDLVVQLEPKELGKMLVKLTSRDGIVTVKILVENADSKIILDNGIQNLKQVFSEQGIKYGRIDVEIGGQFTGQNNQQQPNWFREQQSQRRYDFNEGQYFGDYEPINTTVTTLSNGKVDYLI